MEETNIRFEDLPEAVQWIKNKLTEIALKIDRMHGNAIEKEEPPQWFSIQELCDYLPEHPAIQTVYTWTSANRIPYYKEGKRIRFLKSEIDKWMLNSKEVVAINLKPEVKQELEAQLAPQLVEEQNQAMTVEQEVDNPKVGRVHGQDLDESKGWFREGRHGREVMVEDIQVAPSEQEGKYKMTAIINGESISHEITQKQYDKFMAVDDYHRMKLFSKVFNEVDMKSRGDGVGLGTKIGAALLAGLRMAGDVTYGAADIVHNIEHIKEPHAGPEIYVEQHCAHPRPYFKPGVDTPMDVAARNFEAAMNMDGPDHHMSNGR